MGAEMTSADCPVARPRVRVVDSDAVLETEIDVAPVTRVELNGSLSTAPDGIATYAWEITEKPDGSAAAIEPEPNLQQVEAQLDLTGRYVFSLTVTDTNEAASCELSSAVVNVEPGQGIHVELIRPTAGVGADPVAQPLELHFRNELGLWNDDVWDCTAENTNPDWGESGSTADDPSLFVANEEDLVPSVVTLEEPEDVLYYVGALCPTTPEPLGCSATVRVFLDGSEMTLSSSDRFETGYFWFAVDIDWEQRAAGEFDRFYENGIPAED